MKKSYIIIIVLLVALAAAIKGCMIERKNSYRYYQNQTALIDKVEYYRTKSNHSAASVQQLTLTNNELEKTNNNLTKQLNDMGIKLRRLQAVSTQGTTTTIYIETPIYDTIFVSDSVSFSRHRTFRWNDRWVTINGIIKEDTVTCRVTSQDTLIQVIHRIPRSFLCFKWGTKAIRQDIISKNPHTNIVYTEFIEIKK